MPYRKLPKTDQARVRTLKTVLNLETMYRFHNVPLSYELLTKAKTQLPLFEHHQNLYNQAYEHYQKNNANYRVIVNAARLYISHFIQIFNMAVTRGEFKKEHRSFYKLQVENGNLPDLSNDESLLEWGKNLIDGEMQRVRTCGMPMTNPTSANLRVHYERFKETRTEQQYRFAAMQRTREKFNLERAKTDILIKEIWDYIENFFNELPPEQKIEECTKCGVIYYYRNSENEEEFDGETIENNIIIKENKTVKKK
ncbi:MAG: hypothetical protein LBS50_03875 [Prevotellaceae bacterium]|jgi:hypothetical protein|nr:hypothetical protein [Prevotellaceae bacterium]